MPRLRLSRSYQEIARDKKKMTPENREFIASKLNSANWMIQAIEQRRQTMLKVMNYIVDRQREFFEKGVQHLDRKSTRLNSSHANISYAVFCLKKKKKQIILSKTIPRCSTTIL